MERSDWRILPACCLTGFLLSGCSLSIQSGIPESEWNGAIDRIHHRDYDEAENRLREILNRYPEESKIWYPLGALYLAVDEYPRAEEAFAEGLKRDPENGDLRIGEWSARLLRENYSVEVREIVRNEIKRFLEEGEETVPRLWTAYRGMAYLQDAEALRGLAERIAPLNPEEEILNRIAYETVEGIRSGSKSEDRILLLDRALSIFPPGKSRRQAYRLALETLAEAGDLERLQAWGERWMEEEPEYHAAYAATASWYVKKEVALPRTVEHMQRALALIAEPDPKEKPEHYPEDLWPLFLREREGRYHDLLGRAWFLMERNSEAQAAFYAATERLDFDHRLYAHLGELLERKGDLDGSLQAYLKSAQAGNELPEAEEGLKRLLSTTANDPSRPNRSFARKEGVTTFTEITKEAGLAGVKAKRVAWGDYDRDGYGDLLLDGTILMRNRGDGTFRDQTGEAGIPPIPGAQGGVWADFDNDGFLDFYTFASGNGSRDRFFRNRGDGTFRDITGEAVTEPDLYPSEAAAWGDYDRDGWVDLYLANYERPLPETIDRAIGTPDRLYRNHGDGTFVDLSQEAGMVSREKMAGRGVNWGDYNNDGLLDIHVSNYRLDPNFLWKNNGNGTFTNVAEEAGVAGHEIEGYFGHTSGSAWGDYDNDGDLDLFVANLAHPPHLGLADMSMLLENLGPPDYRFVDRFQGSGIRYEETHTEPTWFDYDNDGFLDLYVTSTYPKRDSFLYKGKGDGTFADVTWLAGVRVDDGFGNAFADIDHDGDPDLVVATGEGVRLFRNDGNGNSWLQIQVEGIDSNRAGIGSRVTVIVPGGSQPTLRMIREVEGGKGAGSQNALVLQFGLGSVQGPVSVEVRFPSGKIVRRGVAAVNQRMVVKE